MAKAVFNLNAHCGTVFTFLDEKDVHSTNQHCPICPLKLKNESKDVKSAAAII